MLRFPRMKKPNTPIKKIMSTRARHVTFSKRRKGLFKKANEISTLCDADVAVVVFSSAGNLFEYSSSNVNRLISMLNETKPSQLKAHEKLVLSSSLEFKSIECHILNKDMNEKNNAIRYMKGENLQDLDVQDLNNLEDSIANSLKRVSSTKLQKLREENELMKQDFPESSIPRNDFGNCYDFLQLRLAT